MSGAAATIRLEPWDTSAAGWFGEWYFPPRTAFLRSDAYEVLRREMRRYVDAEVPGRSFLIAGHRGAGKTSLITRAVDDLQREILIAAAASSSPASGGSGRTVGLQRPFLVKLHGASLVTSAGAAAAPAGAAFWKGEPAHSATHSAEKALQQITVALYRALAQEVAEAFALHARHLDFLRTGDGRRDSELPEMAGQLTMDLDLAPDLAGLRQMWDRMGRLDSGVLWPSTVGAALAAGGLRDRGVREIVALATANQAFQVCIGTIEDKRTRVDAAATEAAVRMEARLDAKELGNKLIGLAAGALAGGALWSADQPAAAVATGLAAGLFSTAALGWSGARSRRAERGVDYSFIVDRSIQTLERDLPLVIERIREAGLAPVFVIDELDKVPNAGEVIRTLIDRLKSLTTDYGFFCFLTGRDYYEEIAQRVRRQAFPTEHTYFSHRLMVLYRPAELAAFVRRMWRVEPASDPAGEAAAWVLSCFILHQARLNTIDVMRAVSALCDEGGGLKPSVDRVRGGRDYLVPMAIQLAIEHILRRPALRLRAQQDPAFAQLAIDALYLISRAWEQEDEVRTSVEDLAADLIARRGLAGDDDAKRAALREIADDTTLGELSEQLTGLARLLTGFQGLAGVIAAEPEFQPTPPGLVAPGERDRVLALLPMLSGLGTDGLLEEVADRHFRFLFDRYGVPLRVRTAAAASTVGISPELAWAVGLVGDLSNALSDLGWVIEQLAAAGALPLSVVGEAVRKSLLDVNASLRGGTVPSPEDVAELVTFARTVQVWSRPIATVVGLVTMIRDDARVIAEVSSVRVLHLLSRVNDDLPALAAMLADMPTPAVPPPRIVVRPQPGSIRYLMTLPPDAPLGTAFLRDRDWATVFRQERDRLGELRPALPALWHDGARRDVVDRWGKRFQAWFAGIPGIVEPALEYQEVVLAAAGFDPAQHLPHDLNRMTPRAWSRFADAMFSAGFDNHNWFMGAGLRALGFGGAVLGAIGAQALATGAPPDEPGTLFVRRAGNSITDDPQNGPRRGEPLYVVDSWPPPEQSRPLLSWLTDHDAVEHMVVEDDGEEDVPPGPESRGPAQ